MTPQCRAERQPRQVRERERERVNGYKVGIVYNRGGEMWAELCVLAPKFCLTPREREQGTPISFPTSLFYSPDPY